MRKAGKVKYWITAVFVTLFLCSFTGRVYAAETIFDSPYVSFSPDGRAWTTNAGDCDVKWYPEGIRIETGHTSKLKTPGRGEHYYKKAKQGNATVGYWQVRWNAGQCIHGYHGAEYHQLQFGMTPCLRRHYSGWMAYCADCGEAVTEGFIYMSEAAARTISYLPLGMDYYYICPFCHNLEQGYTLHHYCKEISANRYRVLYEPNFPSGGKGGGLTEASIHMYDNQTLFEGNEVIPQTRLTRNRYRCDGYRFIGWNTEADGSGRYFGQEATVLNLTDKNWYGEWSADSQGTVVLYAQWEKAVSTLVLNPNGGMVQQSKLPLSVDGEANLHFYIDSALIQPPVGYCIRFDTKGGEPVPERYGSSQFVEWIQEQPFAGSVRGDTYIFPSLHGNVDVLTAKYEALPVLLPKTEKKNSVFSGWYFDEDCTQPVGEELIPAMDITLYAGWVELLLKAEENYEDHKGEGAVDLQWNPVQTSDGLYRIYQRREQETWNPINSNGEKHDTQSVMFRQGKTGREEIYEIPETGIYELSLWGAQGGDYGSHTGGKGGMVTTRIWLEKGEKLCYTVGGTDGTYGGGKGTVFGNGGGCTTVWTEQRGMIAIAGGGGGASLMGDGGPGGSEASVRDSNPEGESGAAGGGAGSMGGRCGELEYHIHTKENCGYHQHVGDSRRGGYCYQRRVNHVHTSACPRELIRYCGGRDWEGNMGWCPNCGVDESGGCTNSDGPGVCVSYYLYKCDNAPYFQLTCNLKEGYFCGKTDRSIESSRPAYGGSSYLNYEVILGGRAVMGEREGDGGIELRSVKIGYQRECCLSGVYAPDLRAPDPVDAETVEKAPAGAEKIVIYWSNPKDNGTTYYHYVEADNVGEETPDCRSNITRTTLCTGIAGYYMLVDGKADTKVTKRDVFLTEGEVRVGLHEVGKYLHIAAADRAGNLSDTTHIPIEIDEVLWNIYTQRLELRSGDNVFYSPEGKQWYVRSDGGTPFYLQHCAVMEGNPGENYQLSEAIFHLRHGETGQEERISINAPFSNNPSVDIEMDPNSLLYRSEGESLLPRYAYTSVKREQKGKIMRTTQAFLPGKEMDGKEMEIIPIAVARYSDGSIDRVRYSSEAADMINKVSLIFDGEGPRIHGLEILRDTRIINGMKDRVKLTLLAQDEVSGLGSFTLQINNRDNGLNRTYTAREGKIQVELSKQDPLFSGNFDVVCGAVDRVGNSTKESFSVTEFELEARIERALAPHDSAFQCGESGWLYLRVRGYAERMEILFPEEWSMGNKEMNRLFDYSDRLLYEQQETVRFMVPLNISADKAYTVTVRAFKKGTVLEQHPAVITVQVKGSILDELRSRLR